jgi:hypothetical protein
MPLPNLNVMKITKLLLPLTLSLVLLSGALLYSFLTTTPSVKFESTESKTIEGKPVFNKIKLESHSTYDRWTMKQSHSGVQLPNDLWDELEIIVDKTQQPFTASFKQFKAGKEVEYRVSCFVCHSNGPRLIRANVNSQVLALKPAEKLQIFWWNLKIKSYGKVLSAEPDDLAGSQRKVPLMFQSPLDKDQLQIKTCRYCHGGNSPFARSMLERQQAGTIEHLVSTGAMPPWPFSLDAHERQQLKDFLEGI